MGATLTSFLKHQMRQGIRTKMITCLRTWHNDADVVSPEARQLPADFSQHSLRLLFFLVLIAAEVVSELASGPAWTTADRLESVGMSG